MEKRFPDFLIIGAPKSGTTSLYFYLLQHPDIFMPVRKEPMFYAVEGQDMTQYHIDEKMEGVRNAITQIDDYCALFKNASADAVCGEASTVYLAEKTTPQRILEHKPDTKLIAILRNPVERAYSHFKHFRRDGLEPLSSFEEAIKSEPQRMAENWFQSYFYLEDGFYAKHINHYLKYFPRNQMRFFLFEDLQNSSQMLTKIFEFLEVNPDVEIDADVRHNPSGKLRLPGVYRQVHNSKIIKPLLRKIIPPSTWGRIKGGWESLIIKKGAPLSPDIKHNLTELYKEDIQELQTILDRDLSPWLQI